MQVGATLLGAMMTPPFRPRTGSGALPVLGTGDTVDPGAGTEEGLQGAGGEVGGVAQRHRDNKDIVPLPPSFNQLMS